MAYLIGSKDYNHLQSLMVILNSDLTPIGLYWFAVAQTYYAFPYTVGSKINHIIILFKNESLKKKSPDQSGWSNWMKFDDRVIMNDPSQNETANRVK